MKKIFTLLLALLLCGIAAQAQEAGYQPLVREGVKWINHSQFVYFGDETYYGPIETEMLQFSGEKVITTESGTHTYKKVKGADNVFMREEDKKVYLLDQQEMYDEFVIYDFSGTDIAMYNNGYEFVENFVLCDTVEIGGKQCRVFRNWNNTSFIIESIGLVSQTYGDLIHTSLIPYAGGGYHYSLDHVEDLEGNILYQSPWNETLQHCDLNGDGRVDIADVNAAIDVMLGKSASNAADITGNGQVDIADVNAVINVMLCRE